jgi:hypothetical protein
VIAVVHGWDAAGLAVGLAVLLACSMVFAAIDITGRWRP